MYVHSTPSAGLGKRQLRNKTKSWAVPRSLPGTCTHVDYDASELGSAGLAALPPEVLVGETVQVAAVTVPHTVTVDNCALGMAGAAAHQDGESSGYMQEANQSASGCLRKQADRASACKQGTCHRIDTSRTAGPGDKNNHDRDGRLLLCVTSANAGCNF